MSLKETIHSDFVAAMKAKDQIIVSTLRMLKADILKKEKELKGTIISDDDVISMISRLMKQRDESAKLYTDGGRTELAEKELIEKKILEKYLPAAITEEKINEVVSSVVQANGFSSMKDIGSCMKLVMAELKTLGGTVDGKLVNELVKKSLS